MTTGHRVPPVPAVLRLVQRSVLGRWRATAEELYREIADLVEAAPGREILVSGSGEGTTAEWLAARTGASVTGVEASAAAIEIAEIRLRLRSRPIPVAFEQGTPDDLPHETAMFDAAIGEPALASAADPARAVAELARVVRPMGAVVLLQLTWSSEITAEKRESVIERLGLRPYLLVEWKQMLRDAGLVDIQVQDWTRGRTGTGTQGEPPGTLTWRDRMQIVGRAWRSSGWHAARSAVQHEERLLRELSRERSLGFQLIRGIKWPHERPTR